MDDLDKKISQFTAEKKQSDRIQKYISSLNESIDKTEKEIEILKDQYVEEVQDVQNLEDRSLNNVFQKILGPGEKALEHERQEALWAYMKLEKSQKSLEILKYEKSVLVRRLISFSYDEEKYQELLKKKEEFLRQFPQMRIKLTLIDHKINTFQIESKEIQEVLDVSKHLITSFEELSKELSQITNWNNAMRNYYGKGHYSSYKKKTYVQRNLELIPKIEVLNQKLNMELEDLKKDYEMDFTQNLTLLNNFFILFLDNLITDWIVRKGIASSMKTIEMCLSKLHRLEMMLKHEYDEITESLGNLKLERKEVILKEKGA